MMAPLFPPVSIILYFLLWVFIWGSGLVKYGVYRVGLGLAFY
jgi:hypothetical protein